MPHEEIDRRQFLSGSAVVLGAGLLGVIPPQVASAVDEPPDRVMPLPFRSALDVARAIQRGEISSVELTKLILDRIEKFNAKVNAVVTVTSDAALERAKAADEAVARKESWGPLHGVPCT